MFKSKIITQSVRKLSQSVKKYGSISIAMGPMFSGKSTTLLSQIRKCKQVNRNALLIKHSSDTRYNSSSSVLITHDQDSHEAIATDTLKHIDQTINLTDISVICIDEGQFYPDLCEYSEKWANLGKDVYVAALDGNFLREPFNEVSKLISLAENIQKLSSICAVCGDSAAFSRRISEEKDVHVVGGSDKYKPMCRGCFHTS